jgi:hypothetical protein
MMLELSRRVPGAETMPSLSLMLRVPLGPLLARLFWSGMLLGHIPAAAAALQALIEAPLAPGAWTRCAILAVSHALFVLKLFDVPWLRLPSSPRQLTALAVCGILLHAGPLVREHVSSASDLECWQAVLVAATVVSLAGAPTPQPRRARGPSGPHSRRRQPAGHVWVRPQLGVLTCRSSRAPPADSLPSASLV